MKFGTFTNRYCVENTLEEIGKMNEEYKETHIHTGIMTKPPKRSPLYKKLNRRKVFDHDRLKDNDNGVGPSHSYCNLQKQHRGFFIHVIFHNGSNYNFHILIRELIYRKEHNILQSQNQHTISSNSIGGLRFIDSIIF